MKIPTSGMIVNNTKPSSGFHICDILELNKDSSDAKPKIISSNDNNNNDDDDSSKINADSEKKHEVDETCDELEDYYESEMLEVKHKQNLSSENDEDHLKEIERKRKHSLSPATSQKSDVSKQENDDNKHMSQDLTMKQKLKSKKLFKQQTSDDENVKSPSNASINSHQQMLNDTIHQYSSHLFQNHPAMRPWFNSNGEHSFLIDTIK
jgi:hypothetical protein